MLWFVMYIAAVWAANFAISHVGVIPVGFGLLAPAGVVFAGLAFSFRDGIQDELGQYWVLPAIIIGAALSGLMSPQLAIASGASFIVSEGFDWLVYTPIRNSGRRWLAIGLSNTVGTFVDSWLFLTLSGFGMAFLAGNIVGKLWSTLAVLALLQAFRLRGKAVQVADVR